MLGDFFAADWHDEFGQNASEILQSHRDYSSSTVESPHEASEVPSENAIEPSTSVSAAVAV